ncbi:hypothetical protein BRADI_3g46473v3 [Brachypodium distachyon]|uniref:Uncharacterized protein n=1 Tax=Brachypodium distachyon TaxID=15368 RepID=A0A2K2D3K6_BRADI|nr:hypothetical protein BRADI_3g46473v3 [Brachypodium distachyon]
MLNQKWTPLTSYAHKFYRNFISLLCNKPTLAVAWQHVKLRFRIVTKLTSRFGMALKLAPLATLSIC